MIWADRIAKELKGKPQHVDDMFTPSGYKHVGSLLGPILHDVMYRVLREQDDKTIFTYIVNDFDVIDGLSDDLRNLGFEKYLGFPLRLAPSPDPKFNSFGEYFTNDFVSVLKELGVEAKIFHSWDLYHQGKFNEVIKTALDNGPKILEIYKDVAGYKKKPEIWYPLQVICPKCSKLGTTLVTDWDGKEVTFSCKPNLVGWAQGCGYTGKISPFDGNGKLPWKVDWPAHWKVLGVTFEGAGKDHASKGGSYDIAFELCKKVFNYPTPYYFPYEFFLFGGKKMSSSKGIGIKAGDITKVLPAEIARFLLIRSNPKKSVDFNPAGNTIPDLFDEFDRCAKAFWDKSDPDMARIFELSQVNNWYKQKVYLPRFLSLGQYSHLDLEAAYKKLEGIIGKTLDDLEKTIFAQRLSYYKLWTRVETKQEIKLNNQQKKYLLKLSEIIKDQKDPVILQKSVFDLAKQENLPIKQAFTAIYVSLTGKTHGPKAGELLASFNKDELIKKLTKTETGKVDKIVKKEFIYPAVNKPDIFLIDEEVKKRHSTINVGIAIIKNVSINKEDKKLKGELDQFLKSLSGLTTDDINQYSEIKSYRRIYKETGIDWHSRRPSPEALLRRIARGKGLYSVNTCVDAYNLIVMKHRVSVGAFDLDKIKFPTILRFAKKGEKIHLLGDSQPSEYEDGELAYFDNEGGINIDFNYRDTQRTMVTQDTKNLWINIEGVYDITREQVEQSMKETIEIIQKYCGGEVELIGITTAS